jgi:hypothetical protein
MLRDRPGVDAATGSGAQTVGQGGGDTGGDGLRQAAREGSVAKFAFDRNGERLVK